MLHGGGSNRFLSPSNRRSIPWISCLLTEGLSLHCYADRAVSQLPPPLPLHDLLPHIVAFPQTLQPALESTGDSLPALPSCSSAFILPAGEKRAGTVGVGAVLRV